MGLGFAVQLNRCGTSCGPKLQSGQISGISPLLILFLKENRFLQNPDLSCDRVVLAFLFSSSSDGWISGGLAFRTRLFPSLSMLSLTELVWMDLMPLFNSRLFVIGVKFAISGVY